MKILTRSLVFILIFVLAFQGNVYAYNYDFDTDYNDKQFGNPTSSNHAHDSSTNENARNDKNVSLYPPSYGVFSGDIPTEQTSPYHEQDTKNAVTTYPVITTSDTGDFLPSTSTSESSTVSQNSSVDISYNGNVNTNYNQVTSVSVNSDGSIGTLHFEEFNKTVKVYSGTSDANMRKGAGHFTNTSEWDGNACFSGHNRGNYAYFSHIKDMKNGDIIRYTTSEGTRKYEVSLVKNINETDQSYLGSTNDNIITLISCIADKPELRLCVQAREILN